MMHRRTFIKAAMAAALPLPLSLQHALASELQKSVRVLVGFPPGGATDAAARWLADALKGTYAQSSIVENKPGAGGRLANDDTKLSAPNGSTLLLTPSSTMALYPHIYTDLSYNPLTDFAPVSHVCDFVHGLAIGPSVPESVNTLDDFLAWCKANPTKANCATPGEGSSPQFLISTLSRASGVELQPIPYKGTGPAITDVVGGQVAAIMVVAEGAYLNFQKEGKIRILATTGKERSPFFPHVPTFKEQGFDTLVFKEWFGLFMPAKTPPHIVDQASVALRSILKQEGIVKKFENYAMSASPSTPAELGAMLKADYDFWSPIINESGYKPLSS